MALLLIMRNTELLNSRPAMLTAERIPRKILLIELEAPIAFSEL